MLLPAARITRIVETFLPGVSFAVLGCLSPEERCVTVPTLLATKDCGQFRLIEVIDPLDAFPDHSGEAKRKIEAHRQRLEQSGVKFGLSQMNLLASEDALIDILALFEEETSVSTAVLDITSLPKRYFCFFLKRMLLSPKWQNVVLTYTGAGIGGYPPGHIAEDPMICDHLPGYAARLSPEIGALVITVGFESLGVRSLIETYGEKRRKMKLIMSFPPNGEFARRQWRTLREMLLGDVEAVNLENLRVMPSWDAEDVYLTLERWLEEVGTLSLAPFGAKPHTLGMALFAIKHDCGLFYSQPKSYNPNYSTGQGDSWAYVVKWQGICCFNRSSTPL